MIERICRQFYQNVTRGKAVQEVQYTLYSTSNFVGFEVLKLLSNFLKNHGNFRLSIT